MSTQSSPASPASPRLLTLALLPALGLALASCNEAKSSAENPAGAARPDKPVLTATVKYEPLAPDRSFVAVIRPRIETDLGFRVPGKVARRLVDVGETVEGRRGRSPNSTRSTCGCNASRPRPTCGRWPPP